MLDLTNRGFRYPRYCISLLFILLIFTISCDNTIDWTYSIPEDVGDGLQTASVESEGLDLNFLTDMMNDLQSRSLTHKIHSILIVKDGMLVFEEYFDGYDYDGGNPDNNFQGAFLRFDRNTVHCMHSATKSFTSALIGLAIYNGFVASDKDYLFSYFPDYDNLKTEDKEKIQLEHVLSNTSGLSWNENNSPITNPSNDLYQIMRQADPIGFILEKPMVAEPGAFFYYSGGNTIILGEVIKRSSGLDAFEFSRRYLFTPLGITNFNWLYLQNNIVYTSGDLYITPRSMVKFGLLFLNKGIWNGNRLLSEEWATKSAAVYTSELQYYYDWADGYGYCWWIKDFTLNSSRTVHAFFATGWGGQLIFVIPELNSVIVFTGGNYAAGSGVPQIVNLLDSYILPAFQ